MKLPDFFANLRMKIMTDKRILSGVVATMVAIISIGGYLGYQELTKRWMVPMVSGANFSLEYRKIPFNTKSIDIVFSTALDPASLTTKNITLSPFVEGKANLKDGNTVSYALDKNLAIGETYTLTISSDIRSVYGKTLGNEQIFTIEAIAGAESTKILPSGKLENLGQNIVVLFNIPMVPLTNLDARDKLPCPLEITPKVEGKCKWTNGNVLEFIPSKPLEMATKYHLKVSDVPGLLYPLINTLEDDIVTPELSVSVASLEFDPKNGIELITTAPVSVSDLLANLTLIKGKDTMQANIVPVKNKDNRESETHFIVASLSVSFLYSTDYRITIKKGLKPKYGTESLVADYNVTVRGSDFLSQSQVYQKMYNASGTLSDTREYNSKYGFPFTDLFPTEKVFFRQTFMSEVSLDKNLFTLRTASGKTVDFTLAYVKQPKYDEHGNTIGEEENKHMVDVTPTVSLENGTIYNFVINKKANNSIPSDVVKTYKTAPKFEILGNAFLSNTETCIYTSTNLDTNGFYSSMYDSFRTIPVSKIHDLIVDGQMDWQTNTKTYRCAQRPGQINYILGTRLEPRKEYSITVPATLEDIYGNKLGKDVSFKVKTVDIAPKDIYLYSSLNKPVQIIPSNLPIVLNLMLINAHQANVEVCEMDAIGYRDYLSKNYQSNYNPVCTKNIKKTIPLKNRFWNITPNKFDVEKDILGAASNSPFLLVRASVGAFNSVSNGYMDTEREFLHVFIRSNLALVLENANNTKILFAPSFDGKTIPSDLIFDTYVSNYLGVLEPKSFSIKWNATKNYYEVSDPDNKLELLIAKNNQFFGVLNKGSDQVSNYDFKYIAGQDSYTKDYLYLYSDRPLYRAGDTVFFKGLLRQFNFDGYKSSPTKTGKLKVVDENGIVLTEMDMKTDKNSNFDGSFVLPKDMPLGHYHFEFYAGIDNIFVYNNGEFYVFAYKKPTFKVNIAADKNDVSIGDRAQISFSSEYYFGGRLVNADYNYSVLTQSYFFNAKDYQDYQFGKGSDYFNCIYWGSCAYGDNLVLSSTGRLDNS